MTTGIIIGILINQAVNAAVFLRWWQGLKRRLALIVDGWEVGE